MLKHALLAGAFALASFTACASQLPDYPFIHAKGSAYVFVMPDMGEIDFDIHAEDASPENVAATLQARIAEMQAMLTGLGAQAAELDVRSVHKNIAKSEKGEDVYVVKCAGHIVVHDLNKWRDVLAPLLNQPNIDNLEVTFGTTQRARLMQDLMGSAVKDAQANADAMAGGFGKHAGVITAITSGELKNLTTSIGLVPGDFYATEQQKHPEGDSRAKDPGALLSINALKMYQSVDVIFRIR